MRAGPANASITTTMQTDQTMACATVVCAVKLMVPLSRAPYQLPGGIWSLTSKA